jgi:hypothetical protein
VSSFPGISSGADKSVSENTMATFLQLSPVTSRLRGPPAALALRYLQHALARHDSAKTSFKYRQAVADTMFEMNQNKKSGFPRAGSVGRCDGVGSRRLLIGQRSLSGG